MFGIVPKALWGKMVKVDKENRIEVGMNCILIEIGKEKILVDTGIGDKLSPKKRMIYGLEGKNILGESLAKIGVKERDITRVIPTHLHLDHSGGATKFQREEVVPAFENAIYYVQAGEYRRANSPNELSRATYLKENFVPLEEKGKLKLLDGDMEIISGVKVEVTKGHTPFHQIVVVESEGERFGFFGDLIPTQWNLRLPYIPAYDMAPEETLMVKKQIIKRCLDEKWKVAFPHDPELGICHLEEKDGEVVAVEIEKQLDYIGKYRKRT